MDTPGATAQLDPAMRQRVVDAICELLPKILKEETPGVNAQTALMDELGMNSTRGLELMLELEELLEVEISVEDLDREHFTTVATLADYVVANVLPDE
jgi:acyl carrier protein